ncbi:helix-turn-helix transcriptional regulator [uncultured Alistipes sp.]|uniref:helix-turn-helix domain-containing protein n=1 Tax=uncultured Alistipes sp. TaxID=538949 RepID=UPI00262FCFBC|nr:helix-turn-helix transcriptional regulator [uncultured Alistipes sp.]
MKEKLQRLMKDEGLTSSRLAEILEIQPSGISHLLSGRNKPGFDLLQKILRRFPRINPDWLLLDSDQMYRAEPPAKAPATGVMASVGPRASDTDEPNLFATASPSDIRTEADRKSDPPERASEQAATAIGRQLRGDVERIVLFYSDHTFDSFVMKK